MSDATVVSAIAIEEPRYQRCFPIRYPLRVAAGRIGQGDRIEGGLRPL
jgi:hypothetical protein